MTVAEQPEAQTPMLLTREQAAEMCGVGVNKIDDWCREPGFPVIREGGHFVRIVAAMLPGWLEARAQLLNPPDPYGYRRAAPPRAKKVVEEPAEPRRPRGRPRKQPESES
jgi:hypothetical protein